MKKIIYLLPGTMCDERLWRFLQSEFNHISSAQYTFRPLTIGKHSSIDEIITDIKQQITTDKILLLGFSLGGYLACAFALKYPSMISQLFIVASMPCELPEREVRERIRTVAWIHRQGYLGIPTKRIHALLDESAKNNDDIIALIKAMDLSLGKNTLLHQLTTTTKRENLFDPLKKAPFNKHFLVGRNDKLVALASLQASIKNDESMNLSILENAGHMLPLEKPREMAQWLLSQIERKIDSR